jgi:peroxiredoxin
MKFCVSLSLILLISFQNLLGQNNFIKNCKQFILTVNIRNAKNDTVILSYYDCATNSRSDTVVLKNGKATFRGKIDQAAEALLFTNIKNLDRDDLSVIRFIIEPKLISLNCQINNNYPVDVKIKGSISQTEKEKWDSSNNAILNLKHHYVALIDTLFKNRKNYDSVTFRKQLLIYENKSDSIKGNIQKIAFAYIKKNRKSQFSTSLLNNQSRTVSIDTLQAYYAHLSQSARNCSFGESILEKINSYSNDGSFKEKYNTKELANSIKKLKKIRNLYDITLLDTYGKKISLSQYKGKYLLLDFWGSWCFFCFENIPYLRNLITSLKGKPIEFLSISLDHDAKKWKESIKKHDFPGINFFDSNETLRIYYKFQFVPHYIIIAPDGKVINADAPHPSDPQLALLLNKLLTDEKKEPSHL